MCVCVCVLGRGEIWYWVASKIQLKNQNYSPLPSIAQQRFSVSYSKYWFYLALQASRAQILNKATDYIQFMRRKNNSHQSDIDDLKKQNTTLEQQSESKGKVQNFREWVLQAPPPPLKFSSGHLKKIYINFGHFGAKTREYLGKKQVLFGQNYLIFGQALEKVFKQEDFSPPPPLRMKLVLYAYGVAIISSSESFLFISWQSCKLISSDD